MQHRRIPIEQFAGNVQALAMLAVFASYRPAGIGALAFVPAQSLGIAHYSALTIMADRLAELEERNRGLVAEAEAKATPEEVLASLAASAAERERNATDIASLRGQLAVETARRAAERQAPALPSGDSISNAGRLTVEPVRPDKPPTPFATFGDQLRAIRESTIAVRNGRAPDSRIAAIQDFWSQHAAASGLNETVGSDGGFAVQQDINNRLLDKVQEEAQVWPKGFAIPLSPDSNGVTVNLVDETSRATGSRWGGVQVYWEPEATTVTAKKPKIFPLKLQLAKLFGIGYRTDEIGQDWQASGALLERAFTSEIAFTLDDAAVRGTGAGTPRGWLNADCLVTVNKETGQDADSIVAENAYNMFARMPARSKQRAVWYINGDLWPQIFQLSQVIGTGGVPLFIPTGAIGDAPGGSLLGRPIVELEQASAPGDVGDFNFVDMNEYLTLDKGGIQRASSIHVEFLTDQEVFRWILRTNGAPGWKSAVTPYKGSLTKSPFVALQAR